MVGCKRFAVLCRLLVASPRRYLLIGCQPLEVIIGLEVHVRINSKYKIFSGCQCMVHPLDEGLPGSLPALNVISVNSLFVFAELVRAHAAASFSFTRKSYFCADLAQGFQITQHFCPLIVNGVLELQFCLVNNRVKLERVAISRACLEHDAASFTRDKTKVSYVRAGCSLLEIVTSPCIDSIVCLKLFIAKLRLVLSSTGISDCVMANSDLRFDLNFSVALPLAKLGCKTEIKNLNWLASLNELVLYEAKIFAARRFSSCKTKGADLKRLSTFTIRLKEQEYEYKHICEANLNAVKA